MNPSKNCHQNHPFLQEHYIVDHGNLKKRQKIPKLFQEPFYNYNKSHLQPPPRFLLQL